MNSWIEAQHFLRSLQGHGSVPCWEQGRNLFFRSELIVGWYASQSLLCPTWFLFPNPNHSCKVASASALWSPRLQFHMNTKVPLPGGSSPLIASHSPTWQCWELFISQIFWGTVRHRYTPLPFVKVISSNTLLSTYIFAFPLKLLLIIFVSTCFYMVSLLLKSW